MPYYLVKSPVSKDGKSYAPGDQIELTEKQADAMPWAVAEIIGKKETPIQPPAPAPEEELPKALDKPEFKSINDPDAFKPQPLPIAAKTRGKKEK